MHVLLTDDEAEHIPGCNMAFRVEALRAINGFDPRFRAAGDDVDVCWRLQDAGWTLGFSPAALVWHHRRNSVLAYWRQQRGYGRAEALLEGKFPHRYNTAGHVTWGGRIYGRGFTLPLRRERRIYHGTWGAAPFQSLYQREPGTLASLPLMPEWFLLTAVLAGLTAWACCGGRSSSSLPLLVAAVGAVIVRPSGARHFPREPRTATCRMPRSPPRCTCSALARPRGRLTNGLTPWRHHRHPASACRDARGGREQDLTARRAPAGGRAARLRRPGARCCAGRLRSMGSRIARRDSRRGAALMAVEELGGGAQLVRYRFWPIVGRAALLPASAGASRRGARRRGLRRRARRDRRE